MNPPRPACAADSDSLEQRFAARVVACLNEGSDRLEPDVTERLRFAREQALARAAARSVAAAAPLVVGLGSSLVLGAGHQNNDDAGLWLKLVSVIPLLLLVIGLFWIEHHFQSEQISAAAEIDAALLADDLPPDAYSDPGFAEFLKIPRD
jgi:Protein of unknown function (DUF3619)